MGPALRTEAADRLWTASPASRQREALSFRASDRVTGVGIRFSAERNGFFYPPLLNKSPTDDFIFNLFTFSEKMLIE